MTRLNIYDHEETSVTIIGDAEVKKARKLARKHAKDGELAPPLKRNGISYWEMIISDHRVAVYIAEYKRCVAKA